MLAVTVCFLTLAVAFDLRTDRIPNALNLTGLTTGLLTAYESAGSAGLLKCIEGAAAMLAVVYGLWVIRALRGGDGKLLCALTALLGKAGGFRVLLGSLILAAVIGLPLMRRQRGRRKHRTPIHYSVPIACGAAIYLMMNGGV